MRDSSGWDRDQMVVSVCRVEVVVVGIKIQNTRYKIFTRYVE